MIPYKKLVRGNIPNTILASGRTASTRILGNEEYFQELIKKLYEEISEYQESLSVEEIADILEVLYAIIQHQGFTKDYVEEIRMKKRKLKGGFDAQIYLESVSED